MKKFILLFLPIILFSTSLFATEKLYSFIGIQASPSLFNDTIAPSIALKYGKQSKEIRTSIAYGYGKNGNNTYQTMIMQIDTGILTKNFKDIDFKPYVGASLGLIQHKNKKLITYDDKGFIYGINTGLSYIVNNNLDFDLGYRFMKTSKLKEIETINDLSLSMHYFY
jgi:hypothetical protein